MRTDNIDEVDQREQYWQDFFSNALLNTPLSPSLAQCLSKYLVLLSRSSAAMIFNNFL